MRGIGAVVTRAACTALAAATFAIAADSARHSASAATYVVAIGINDYNHEEELGGAVADARDIAETLSRQGARVTLLTDRQATRARIVSEWSRVLGEAQSGDTVLLSYAGHGGQEPDSGVMDEADGMDEAYLLSGFNPDMASPGFAERIVDDEIHQWLLDAGRKGISVIFVADACHSGTMTRGIDERVKLRFRSRPPYGPADSLTTAQREQRAVGMAPVIAQREAELFHVTTFSATSEDLKAPEVEINKVSRGALSYAVARGLEGAADADGDQKITRLELMTYVGPQVRQFSEARQTAEMMPRGGSDPVVHALDKRGDDELRRPPVASAGDTKARLAILGMPEGDARRLVGRLKGVEYALDRLHADLLWDAEKRDVISGLGDPVAHGIGVDRLQGVIDRWRTLGMLKTMMAGRSIEMHVGPGDGRHAAGKQVSVLTEPLGHAYVVAIDLAPDGSMNLLHPGRHGSSQWTSTKPYSVKDLIVREPFGVDHVLVIASSKPIDPMLEIHNASEARVLKLPVGDLPARLEKELAGADYKLGLTPVYTWKGN